MICKIVKSQKLMSYNIILSTKSQTIYVSFILLINNLKNKHHFFKLEIVSGSSLSCCGLVNGYLQIVIWWIGNWMEVWN